MSNNTKLIEIGTLRKDKDGGFYILVNPKINLQINGNNISNTEGRVYLNVKKPHVKLDNLLKKGSIDQKEYNRRLENIPEYVKYEVSASMIIDGDK